LTEAHNLLLFTELLKRST